MQRHSDQHVPGDNAVGERATGDRAAGLRAAGELARQQQAERAAQAVLAREFEPLQVER